MATFVPRIDTVPLFNRLENLARSLRTAAFIRGVCLALAVPAAAALAAGWLDYALNMPPFVRAFALVGVLAALGVTFVGRLVRPMNEPLDPMHIAVRLEGRFPELNDALASAVNLTEAEDGGRRVGSDDLRREAVTRAVLRADEFDFSELLRAHRAGRAFLALVVVVCAAGALQYSGPGDFATAAGRLFDPFGRRPWTAVTVTEPADSPARIAKGDTFTVKLRVDGVRPESLRLHTQLAGSAKPHVETYPLTEDAAEVEIRLGPDRVPRDFRFRVTAYDGDTGWRDVAVDEPPRLVPLDGRRSPQLRLSFPDYTGLDDAEPPAGSGVAAGPPGTRVRLAALADRPLAAAAVEYRPAAGDTGEVPPAIPVAISEESRRLEADFVPTRAGVYALKFTDTTGLPGEALLEVRLEADTPPRVALSRPAEVEDALEVVPTASFALSASFADRRFGLRSAAVEYRVNDKGPTRSVVFFDAGELQPLGAGLLRPLLRAGVALPLGDARPGSPWLRPPRWDFAEDWPVARFLRPDGRPVRPGDVVTFRATARDHDAVTADKPPGRSREVRLRVVSPETLADRLGEKLLDLRPELLALREEQKQAREKADDGQDVPGAAESQRKIRDRLAAPGTGLADRAAKLAKAAERNGLPETPASLRLKGAADRLKRLAADDAARAAAELERARQGDADALGKARWLQRQVEGELSGLLDRLEPWGAAGEARGDARKALNDLRRRMRDGDELGKRVPLGQSPDRLSRDQREALGRQAAGLQELADRAAKLADDIDKKVRDRQKQIDKLGERIDRLEKKGDAESRAEAANLRAKRDALEAEADALRKGAAAGAAGRAADQLRRAAAATRDNRLSGARDRQRRAEGELKSVVGALAEPDQPGGDRLRKRNKEAEDALRDLADGQDRLQKKIDAARRIADPAEREAALKKLAEEQERLQRLTRQARRQLERQNQDESAMRLKKADEAMDEARRQMDEGQPPERNDAGEQLQKAQDELKKPQPKDDGEKLAREQRTRVAQKLKGLAGRQKRAAAERQRIAKKVIAAKRWDRAVLTSLQDLGDRQAAMAEEADGLAEADFTGDPVFKRMLRHAADAMRRAGERVVDWQQDALDFLPPAEIDPELEGIAAARVAEEQDFAARRLGQLVEALKPPQPGQGDKAQAGQPKQGEQPKPPEQGDKAQKPQGPKLPNPAQLKALRMLQVELKGRTEAFLKAHPDPEKRDAAAKHELADLKKAQQEIVDLFVEVTTPKDQEAE